MLLIIKLDGDVHREDLPLDLASREAQEWAAIGASVRLKESYAERARARRERRRQEELMREHVFAVAAGIA